MKNIHLILKILFSTGMALLSAQMVVLVRQYLSIYGERILKELFYILMELEQMILQPQTNQPLMNFL